MAKRRMFSKEIIDTDHFLSMSAGAQLLYFHLGLQADDDGFIANPKRIMKIVDAKEDDIILLNQKGYIIPFDSGIIVITHWNAHNYLRPDRYHPSIHLEERNQLGLLDNGSYICINPLAEVASASTNCLPLDVRRLSEVRSNKSKKSSQKEISIKSYCDILQDEEFDRLDDLTHGHATRLIDYLDNKLSTFQLEHITDPYAYALKVAKEGGFY